MIIVVFSQAEPNDSISPLNMVLLTHVLVGVFYHTEEAPLYS